ncbi:Proline--tRNA ligase [Mesomycoplasma conjunctivae]|uniref:Proline--tRNA ligase n=1 Tax=Mesomycoplasma conjunctivae (strain ATCC 25834 / NCTC 10147 / HRC/581) TaxID=572263 RepID=C5J5L6_MESCH|nr:proline--tRNA ligase [Mesomycoplasma conjunctivae]CAT04739.1 Prolyl-tRNA synthetase [Mesomycoplasma conjunctivae]VEU65749.1 Proline--tRNA ligase [Mesomycoplasma conjunctivae]
MKKLEKITPWKQDFAKWYVDVITQAELMSYGPVKGTMYLKPNGYAIWSSIQDVLNFIFQELSIKNVYFPSLIPQSFIEKEKQHVKGFAPELLTITHVGEKKLPENIYLRPTSEVLFADFFKKEIAHKNKLPILLNQWCQVTRWEKTTNPFLRTTEFLWQEGHTVHEDSSKAKKFAKIMIENYKFIVEKFLAIPVIVGKKTQKERFAGAKTTYTIEAMMKDGRALQAGTSHYLGQNFSKNFDITFKNKDNQLEYVYQTSWGVSTRLIGALIMTHGDDRGIIIPPAIAEYKVDILAFFVNKHPNLKKAILKLSDELDDFHITNRVDLSDNQVGFKIANSEVLGTPVRIEIGPRDLEAKQVVVVRRDTLEKKIVPTSQIVNHLEQLFQEIQANLFEQAKHRLTENIVYVDNYENFKVAIAQSRFVVVAFSETQKQEIKIQEETGATSRCIVSNKDFIIPLPAEAKSLFSGKKTNKFVVFAKSY